MAVSKTIQIDGQEIPFKASAAVPRIYRARFGRDIMTDMQSLGKVVDANNAGSSSIDALDLELFENLAWVMARHADPSVPDTPDEWLERFNTFSIYLVLPPLMELWGLNTETKVAARKNAHKAAGK